LTTDFFNRWKKNVSVLSDLLNSMSVRDHSGSTLLSDDGFSKWIALTKGIYENNRVIFFIGNGASASMASHFATDIAKNVGIRASVFTDFSLMTALANDISFEEVYAEPLRWGMKKEDMLIAISSSGNSPNILRGVETAQSIGGTIVTLSAMSEGNAIRKLGDLNFYVPAQTYGLAETAHAAILHYWLDSIEASHRKRKS